MRRHPDRLEEMDTLEARFGGPTLRSGPPARMVVPVIDLGLAEHPLSPGRDLRYLDRGYLVFEGVSSSSRDVCDYDSAGRIVEPGYRVDDLARHDAGEGERVFRLQGVEGLDPGRYATDWRIVARGFELQAPDDARLGEAPFGLDALTIPFLQAAPAEAS